MGWNPCLLHLLHWQADSLPLVPAGKPKLHTYTHTIYSKHILTLTIARCKKIFQSGIFSWCNISCYTEIQYGQLLFLLQNNQNSAKRTSFSELKSAGVFMFVFPAKFLLVLLLGQMFLLVIVTRPYGLTWRLIWG